MNRALHAFALATVLSSAAAAQALVPEPATIPAGVVVEEVQRGFVADLAGVKADDVLVSWSRPNGDPGGQISSPLLIADLEYGELPRGAIHLAGTRGGSPLEVEVRPDAIGLGLTLRPRFPPELLEMYRRGRNAIEGGRVNEGAALWREAAARARRLEGGASGACWLLGKVGTAWAVARRAAEAHEAYDDAVACAENDGDPREVATLLEWQATQAYELGEPLLTAAALEIAFGLRDGLSGSPELSVMETLFDLALVLPRSEAQQVVYPYMLALAERHAPDSLLVSRVLLQVGLRHQLTGELDTAERTFVRAAEIAERVGPWSSTWARAQTAIGGLIGSRGDLAGREERFRKAMEQLMRQSPGSLDAARSLVNMSMATAERGDLDAGRRWARAALRMLEPLPTGRAIRAAAANNLGELALLEGDVDEAVTAFERSAADIQAVSPRSIVVAAVELNLGKALAARGDADGARHHADRALAHAERHGPRSTTMVEVLVVRGDLARSDGEWDVAADCYARALEVLEDLLADSDLAAHANQGLASVMRHRGDDVAAELHLRKAVAQVEAKRSRVGRSDEERSLFLSSFHGVYRDLIELLVGQGRTREAFAVLEASRARSLVSMLAARDLRFELDTPPEQERERRAVDAAYERARGDLDRVAPTATVAEVAALQARVDELRERQLQLGIDLRQASPRLAALREPQPLEATDVAAHLEPGTLLIAYSVGVERTAVFALERDGALEAHLIPAGVDELLRRVGGWRSLAQASPPGARFHSEARQLHDLLLGPLRRRMLRAQRLVISTDGPLHGLPFAALRDEGGFLIESKALAFVPSGSFYAQQSSSCAPRSWSAPAAFGDPRYAADSHPALPGSRREVASVAAAFPATVRYVGRDATEDKVRNLARDTRFVHFAVHGVIAERTPLDSALALSPGAASGGAESGMLYAWEIFERVRVDADLVTLSACQSAAGVDRPGEGLIGLTRAFLHAGARSVLASLWNVGDASTGTFMRTFYEGWSRGDSKVEALRKAQVGAIRRGQRPLRWAAFQLYGHDR